MSILDDIAAMAKLDAEGMARLIEHFDEQITQSIELGAAVDLSGIRKDFTAVVVFGMGGSAIGGDLLATALAPVSPLPVVVSRDYSAPAWVGKNTLVFASSYSGNTHETVGSVEQARAKGAQVVAISSDGRLSELAKQHDLPLITVPGGQPPRASMGYMFVPLWVVAHRLGLCPSPNTELQELATLIRSHAAELGTSVHADNNYAKQLAEKLFNHPIYIYSVDGPLAPVSYRWRGQIQENGKMLAVSHSFPEICHNEITGYEQPQDYVHDAIAVVLRDPDEVPPLQAQVETSVGIMRQAVREVIEIEGKGSTAMVRALGLIYLGDWVSFYLAMLNNADPTSIKSIKAIKDAMKKAGG
jgi:glucose/mannose-6-phosphate isomerase